MTAGQSRRPIDWREVHRRVDAAREALERGGTPTAEAVHRILHARAQALAAEPAGARRDQKIIDVVSFVLSEEHYGIELPYVREVLPLGVITALPSVPAFVLGLINVRGQIASVIDLRAFFDLPPQAPPTSGKIILLKSNAMELGVLVDSMQGVRSLRADELHPVIPTLSGMREAYIKAITEHGLVLLDAARLLSDRNIVVDEHVEQ
jgi:purine-binding chemotaxis protein CheW